MLGRLINCEFKFSNEGSNDEFATNNRGNDIFGLNFDISQNDSINPDTKLTFTPLLYGNGPGHLKIERDYNLTYEMTSKKIVCN
jgi:hypothetical protein